MSYTRDAYSTGDYNLVFYVLPYCCSSIPSPTSSIYFNFTFSLVDNILCFVIKLSALLSWRSCLTFSKLLLLLYFSWFFPSPSSCFQIPPPILLRISCFYNVVSYFISLLLLHPPSILSYVSFLVLSSSQIIICLTFYFIFLLLLHHILPRLIFLLKYELLIIWNWWN